ncbi:hypothetical protein CCHR01_11096 [Colletotrichum chrysophilum]|uniref:Uncharacterized protein n=1 Tax=Colletotrichum chrysophilum TaxID=1836956 RepID=A0AAD9EG52_9PEZI|nr:hypothetical protein CCHR01_11096 [Colletotrichum chrysophilum]
MGEACSGWQTGTDQAPEAAAAAAAAAAVDNASSTTTTARALRPQTQMRTGRSEP